MSACNAALRMLPHVSGLPQGLICACCCMLFKCDYQTEPPGLSYSSTC
jgi:hypothetical protein